MFSILQSAASQAKPSQANLKAHEESSSEMIEMEERESRHTFAELLVARPVTDTTLDTTILAMITDTATNIS